MDHSNIRSSMDCSALLKLASETEQTYEQHQTFGHPVYPQLRIFDDHSSNTQLLCVAFTDHTVFASSSDNAPPELIAELGDERIRDVLIVEEEAHNNNADTIHAAAVQQQPEESHVVLLIATSRTLYTVEYDCETHRICEFHNTSLFEVFDWSESPHEHNQTGVAQLQSFENALYIVYDNASIVKVHPSSVFPSNWERASQLDLNIEEFCGNLTLYAVHYRSDDARPKHLTCLPHQPDLLTTTTQIVLGFGSHDHPHAQTPLLTVYSSQAYNNNKALQDSHHSQQPRAEDYAASSKPRLSSVTSALMGTAMGALRWGLGSTQPDEDDLPHDNTEESVYSESRVSSVISSDAPDEPNIGAPFPSLFRQPIHLTPELRHHDVPRQLENLSVHPRGTLAAGGDGLGRVLLMDATTKQLIRIWKGYRDASVFWIKASLQPDRPPVWCIVLHARSRRVVEVWKLRHGPKVTSVPVSKDAQLIQAGSKCYLLHTSVPSGHNRVELLQVLVKGGAARDRSPDPSVAASSVHDKNQTPSKQAALRLQHFKQLLSTGNVQYSKHDVRKALMEIKSLADLSTALDLLAVSGSILEESLGVEGTAFHKEALSYCRSVLNAAVHRGKGRSSEMVRTNLHVQLLSHKIEYHTQMVKAFDILHKFEKNTFDGNQQATKTPSHWAAEAMAWASTYEQVSGSTLDASLERKARKSLKFYEFAGACMFPEVPGKTKAPTRVYFSDSSRTRREILEHIFKPLLADVFSFNIVYAIFDSLGTRADCHYVQQCFGEWFMTLSVKEAYHKGLHCENPPLIRLLQDLVTRQLASGPLPEDDVVLNVVYTHCTECTDLVRAFMLGSLCLEAVSRAALQKEKWTYGKIKGTKLINDWKRLLRRLRICLLVSLRMNGTKLAAPVTIDNVEQPDIFSVHKWVATDELSMTHNHEEILSLERACEMSSYSFDPSTEEGDGPARFKVLQNSCLSAAIDETQRSEYLVDSSDDNKMGALLLFMRRFNDPELLAAHRALVLASSWMTHLIDLDCLKDGIAALKSLQKNSRGDWLMAAVALEIWRTHLCSIFRAHLFGFDELHGIEEDTLSPLLRDTEWFTAVGRMALQVLALLRECRLQEAKPDNLTAPVEAKEGSVSKTSWPVLRGDFLLERLADRVPRSVDESAVDAHSVVICALLVSGDIKRLVECVPSIYDLFTQSALFDQVPTTQDVPELQQYFLNDAVFSFAKRYTGPPLDSFDLGEIETLARVWNFDFKTVRTLFLLATYELGKDSLVDDLVTKAPVQIDVHGFVEDGVNIACRRLDKVLSSRRRRKSVRDAMGLLDADTCEWIKSRVEESTPVLDVKESSEVEMEATNLFVMRLLSLSSSSDVTPALKVKIHALVVLSGILAKALSDD